MKRSDLFMLCAAHHRAWGSHCTWSTGFALQNTKTHTISDGEGIQSFTEVNNKRYLSKSS